VHSRLSDEAGYGNFPRHVLPYYCYYYLNVKLVNDVFGVRVELGLGIELVSF